MTENSMTETPTTEKKQWEKQRWEKQRSHFPISSLRALALTLLFLGSTAVPVLARAEQTASQSIQKEAILSTATIHQFAGQSVKSAQSDIALEAEIEQMVAQMMEAEIQHWSPAEKSALKTMESVGLKDSEIAALTTMSAADFRAKMKTDKKLAQLNAAGISSEEALKLAPTLLLSRYLLNIGRAAVWGGVVTAIRSADLDYRALSVALTSGNTRQFMSLLGEGLTGQTSFLNLMSSAATFACGSATLDFTPGLCDRFASGLQKIFTRVERSGDSRQAPSAPSERASRQSESIQSESIQSESESRRSRFFRRLRSTSSSEPALIKR